MRGVDDPGAGLPMLAPGAAIVGVHVLAGLIWLVTLAGLASRGRRAVETSNPLEPIVERVTGCAFLGFGAGLVLSG